MFLLQRLALSAGDGRSSPASHIARIRFLSNLPTLKEEDEIRTVGRECERERERESAWEKPMITRPDGRKENEENNTQLKNCFEKNVIKKSFSSSFPSLHLIFSNKVLNFFFTLSLEFPSQKRLHQEATTWPLFPLKISAILPRWFCSQSLSPAAQAPRDVPERKKNKTKKKELRKKNNKNKQNKIKNIQKKNKLKN